MKRAVLPLVLLLAGQLLWAEQAGVPRIDQMPNLPTTYGMRNWKQTALDYDALVFDTARKGDHLPLATIRTAGGINYPAVRQMALDTYVGWSSHARGAEGINAMPAVVGASLMGIDKTNQGGINWVEHCKDYFNRGNGQNVFLNNFSAGTGSDWWYELMPNVYFYQLMTFYKDTDADFPEQMTTVANRELEMVYKLGGSIYPRAVPFFNYRAFNHKTGLGREQGVKEPEAAGSTAWILHQAFLEMGDSSYYYGAIRCLEFLNGWSSNPSYELQLPYGIITAARLNAEHATCFNMDKLIRWTFSEGLGTLRRWGLIVGNWSGYDMSGLIGEANDGGNDYAFVMNGFQHAGALAPVPKYDKRYSRAIAKWMLHVASASRYFYTDELPEAHQQPDSYAWSVANDTARCIPYEAIKEQWGDTKPRAMGDAYRSNWAKTDLSLYSGSSVGYLAAVVDTTDVTGILRIDMNATDWRGNNTYPHYLYYNPYDEDRSVSFSANAASMVYDIISERVLVEQFSGDTVLTIPADGVISVVVLPAGSSLTQDGRLLKCGTTVVDYRYGYDYTDGLRQSALRACTAYPNPTAGPFTLHLPEAVGNVAVFDAQGRLCHQARSHQVSLPAALPAGLYHVRATTHTGQPYETQVLKQ